MSPKSWSWSWLELGPDIVVVVLLCGVASWYCTELLRKLPPFKRWATGGIRPWSCDVCMSAWSALVCAVALWGSWWGALLVVVAAAAGVQLLLHRHLGELPETSQLLALSAVAEDASAKSSPPAKS